VLALFVILVFILQRGVDLTFLVFQGHLPLAIASLSAAAATFHWESVLLRPNPIDRLLAYMPLPSIGPGT
jgi:hypothetical protein